MRLSSCLVGIHLVSFSLLFLLLLRDGGEVGAKVQAGNPTGRFETWFEYSRFNVSAVHKKYSSASRIRSYAIHRENSPLLAQLQSSASYQSLSRIDEK